ncbi:DNA excision repair protein ERCC-1 [Geosmithia morbida]|uniref:DNA excision repair protein ERCC-1 n=1 Tax=Geosmithia morbida TaxID=1094350 RepID=A0A9P5D0X6_9HYPO|nr:DNA excision repair protein ERCC-1 [Geosmithia morbida]KAF4122117.1 DNA excision repair protein ERCC-1 [Geosmithia morbida]
MDEFIADDDLLEAMAAIEPTLQPAPPPRKVQQPTPQRLDRAPPPSLPPPPPAPNTSSTPASTSASASASASASTAAGPKIVQPTPQALPQRSTPSSGSTILVSPRQRGNPVVSSIKSVPWEYSDIPADYAMGLGTCALFLSLRYHRLHPEYIYTRIRNLQGRYKLRIVLTMVDIANHEDPLRELSTASLVNGVTLVCCWSAAEAARYLELYKSYEHAGFAAIRGQQSTAYTDRLVDFVTVPRSLNKSDAVAMVANFGSLRSAVNADPEHLALIGGWGGTKVKRWTAAVNEPFRVRKKIRRVGGTQVGAGAGAGVGPQVSSTPSTQQQQQQQRREDGASQGGGTHQRGNALSRSQPSAAPRSQEAGPQPSRSRPAASGTQQSTSSAAPKAVAETSSRSGQLHLMAGLDDGDADVDEEAMIAAAIEESKKLTQRQRQEQQQQPPKSSSSSSHQQQETRSQEKGKDQLSDGVAAALERLRQGGG